MVEKWIEKGIAHCKSGEFEKGVDCFNQVLKMEPKNIQGLYNRARALSRVGKLADCLIDFRALTEIQPNNPTFIGDYAVALHLNNDNTSALTQFNLALSLEPQNPYRYSSRAFFYDRIGELEQSIQDYEKAIELDPEDAISMNNKGLVEEKMGYKEKANKSFDRSNKVMGYDPSQSKSLEDSKAKAKVTQEKDTAPMPENPTQRWDIIKSVFTKEGFSDFLKFSKGLVGKKDKV